MTDPQQHRPPAQPEGESRPQSDTVAEDAFDPTVPADPQPHIARPWHEPQEEEAAAAQPSARADEGNEASRAERRRAQAPSVDLPATSVPRPWHDSGSDRRATQRPAKAPQPASEGGTPGADAVPRKPSRPPPRRGQPSPKSAPRPRSRPARARSARAAPRPRRRTAVVVGIAVVTAALGGLFAATRPAAIRAEGVMGAYVKPLKAPATVHIGAIDVHRGEHVKAGQIIATTTNPRIKRQLSRIDHEIAREQKQVKRQHGKGAHGPRAAALRNRIDGLRQQLRQLGHQYANDQAGVQNAKAAVQAGEAGPSQVVQAQVALAHTKARYVHSARSLQALRQQLHQLEAGATEHATRALERLKQSRQRLETKLKHLQIRAPATGVITAVRAKAGQTVPAATALVSEASTGPRHAVFYFAARARSSLSVGQTLQARTAAGRHVRLRIDHIFTSAHSLPANVRRNAHAPHNAVVVIARPVNPHAAHLPLGTRLQARLHH